ncbi:hypothetical protein BH23BAC1_BH23BAC1_43590 [soil metagenome]
MKITKSIKNACIEIENRDIHKDLNLNLRGKGRNKAVTLKGPYSVIASKFLYYETIGNRKVFSWQQITGACKIADLYVTDVVSQQLKGIN